MRFKNKEVAIVTGASKGIGVGIAKVLSREGCRIVCLSRNLAESEIIAREIREEGGDAIAMRVDVSVEEDVKQMVKGTLEHYGRIDILVNNAGLGVYRASWTPPSTIGTVA